MKKCIDCRRKISYHATRCPDCCHKYFRGEKHFRWKKDKKKCLDCKKILTNQKARRCRTCHDEYNRGEHNPLWKRKPKCINCGKELKKWNAKRCKSCEGKTRYGKNGPYWKGGPKRSRCIDCGKKIFNKSERCNVCRGKKFQEEDSPCWKTRPKCLDCGKIISLYAKRCKLCSLKILIPHIRCEKNKKEIFLEQFLEKIVPKEYNFVGDGKFWLERFNPDFININSKKKIIELFGDYWHKRKGRVVNDRKRISVYRKYGYDCLVIWENELKQKNLAKRILDFNERKIKHFMGKN